ncbi:PREDICTED: uncharacterized protein LOC106808872 [Priapulus caudatus]|uniref:Uncharacterized protein LOC106808872 n=1 Tax=Priapulus caudatus TaxID=37621 RepID=A0ABM1E4X9_PRICU|nr:PREDICTED: uncharacterized protein LOC106808872 [Priapulus caudatus]
MISTPAVSRMVVACAVNVLIHDGEAAPQMLPLVAPVLQLLDRRADEKLASVALTFVEVMLGMSEVVDSVVVHIEESCSASSLQFLMARGHEETKKVVDGIQAKRS